MGWEKQRKSFTVSDIGTEPTLCDNAPGSRAKTRWRDKGNNGGRKSLQIHGTGLRNGHGVKNSCVWMTAPAAHNLNLKGNTVVSEPSEHRVKLLCVKFPSCFYCSFTPEGPVHKKTCLNYTESPMVSQEVGMDVCWAVVYSLHKAFTSSLLGSFFFFFQEV